MRPPVLDPNWDPEVKALYHHDMQEIWDPAICRHIWNQYHNQLDVYLELAPPPDPGPPLEILDVGCAQGTLALLLAERGHRVLAVDLREAFLDYARSRYTHGEISFLSGNVLEMDLPRRFDLIYANQLIEHLVYPDRMVGRLKALLKPGGRLVVTTPNFHYLPSNLPSFDELGDPSRFEELQFTADGDGHFFAYRAEELLRIFGGGGLVDLKIRYFESPIISGHMRLRHLHPFTAAGLLRALDRGLLATPLARRLAHQLMILGRNP